MYSLTIQFLHKLTVFSVPITFDTLSLLLQCYIAGGFRERDTFANVILIYSFK